MAEEEGPSPEDLKRMSPEERIKALRAMQARRRKELEERQRQIEEEISKTEELLHETEEEVDEELQEEQLQQLQEERDTLEGLIEEEGIFEEGREEQEERLHHGRETGYQTKERLEYQVEGGSNMRPGENIHFHRESRMSDLYRRADANRPEERETHMSDVYRQEERDRPGIQEDYQTSEQTHKDSNLSTNILREMYRH